MPNDVISTCPVCSHELAVTRLHCRSCGTTLEGDFSVGRFGRLSREQLALLESFLRSRGNLRDMERELGISYPTVRNRVEALVRALGLADGEPSAATVDTDRGYKAEAAPAAASTASPAAHSAAAPTASTLTKGEVAARRQALLQRLAAGELTADQVAAEIRALGTGA